MHYAQLQLDYIKARKKVPMSLLFITSL